MIYRRPVTWYLLLRPCGCGQPVAVESTNPQLGRLLSLGYKHVGTVER